MTITIFHNPRCSKSRQTLALLEERGKQLNIVLYLETPPTVQMIEQILRRLGFASARDLMRTKESIYKELGLKETQDERALVAAMVAHPILIERPIVMYRDQARIGRPPEAVLDIL
jgi:arsenate reductase